MIRITHSIIDVVDDGVLLLGHCPRDLNPNLQPLVEFDSPLELMKAGGMQEK